MNNSDQEFKCVLCDETFPTKEELQVHFRKHADPNFKQKKVRAHNETDTVEKQKENVEMVECDVCPEMFTSISKAITHKHKAHPDHDSKYFCTLCGKLFTMKHLYNKHVKSAHPDIENRDDDKCFHCDTCNVDFIHSAIVYHNKFYHRQDDLPIIGNSKKYRMLTQEMVSIYYCPFCGEEFDNKVNLHKHMSDDHSDENQSPEEVLRCPLCEAIFYHLDAYELHLTYHSIEDMYTERNPLIDETTDFSLETVQPQREKIENAADLQTDNAPSAMGIEELLEFTMDTASVNRKSKKHKKHKKSKKAAITLDEFLNMNKDVFGEGIDFQGVEEVPTQVIAKRLKTKKSPTKVVSSDIAKLKRQGIVIKKQPTKVGKPIIVNKGMKNQVIKTLKKVNSGSQAPLRKLSSTNDVLSKLLNQGSQIKIVKKSNQDEDQCQHDNGNLVKDDLITEKINEDNDHLSNNICRKTEERKSDVPKGSEYEVLTSEEHVNVKMAPTTTPGSPTINNDKDSKTLETTDEICSNTKKIDDVDESQQSYKETFGDSFDILRNNSNIVIKKSKQNLETKEEQNEQADNKEHPQYKDSDSHDEENLNDQTEKSCLNAYKHLSHLITIKSVSQSPKSPVLENKKLENGSQNETETTPITANNSAKKADVKNLSNVKNLSEITIKSSSNTQKRPQTVNAMKIADPEPKNVMDAEWNENYSIENQKTVEKIAHILKNSHLSVQNKHSSKTNEKESPKVLPNNDNKIIKSSGDLAKHLKNITVNPVVTNNQKIQTPKSSPNTTKTGTKTPVQKEITEEGVEIFNIDDSDSDEGNCKKNICTSNNTINNKLETNKSIDFFKNVSKNVTIKSNKTEKHIQPLKENCDDSGDDFDEGDVNEPVPCKLTNSLNSSKQNQAVHNVLKNLGKNITIKSRNSSPSQCAQSQDYNSRDTQIDANDDNSDTEHNSSPRVKITEIENTSDGEFSEEHEDNNISQENAIVKVQHPDDSHSEPDEFMDDDFENMEDIEAQIKPTTVHKLDNTSRSRYAHLHHPQNIKNDLSVKISQTNQPTNDNSKNVLGSEDLPEYAKNLSNQISIKQIKKPESKTKAAHSFNQSLINQNVASSSNQVSSNMLNKEVKTVKTYRTQTETVIEEITTTVTKTIKTVNQTTKQEVRNTDQSSSSRKLPQKIHGMNTNAIQKNFQGIKVRQSAPINVRPKIRGPLPQVMRPAICPPPQATRPAICPPPHMVRPAAVRASNQLVPVRPTINRPSGPRPRLPNAMNVRASTSGQQRPQVGKTVKISPGAVISPPKRPAEPAGHFSCFKKPRESLIPVPDYPDLNKSDGESVQFSSAVHLSKSNFSSMTKTVKGNTVVTSTKMKSEMSASSQQLNKLQNMSGLSVVKTSQAKQSHVEEQTEISASKRNTLEAIQKLQNQGLLVKKPRLDVNEESAPYDPDSDEMGHPSDAEFDDFE